MNPTTRPLRPMPPCTASPDDIPDGPFEIVFADDVRTFAAFKGDVDERTEMLEPNVYGDWREKVVFAAEEPQPQALLETSKMKVVLVGLEPGQQIPAHPAPPAIYHFLEGSGWMSVDGKRIAVRPGVMVVAPDRARRGVEAETRLSFIGMREQ